MDMEDGINLSYGQSVVIVIWSSAVITVIMLAVQFCRMALQRATNMGQQTWQIIDEFTAFLQLSSVILELMVVANVFGASSMLAYSLTFVTMVIKQEFFIRYGLIGIPTTFVGMFYLNGRQRNFSYGFAMAIIGAQLAGSLLAHPVVRLLWGSVYSEFHNRHVLVECRETLEVDPFYGFTIEFVTCLIYGIVDWQLTDRQRPIVRVVLVMILAEVFQRTSGVWMHPVLATAHTSGCAGSKGPVQHTIVYWVAPFLAEFLFFEALPIVQGLSKNSKMTPEADNNNLQQNGTQKPQIDHHKNNTTIRNRSSKRTSEH